MILLFTFQILFQYHMASFANLEGDSHMVVE